MKYTENDDIWRLYRREWVVAHTITRYGDDDGRNTFDACVAWAKENFDGRVRTEDINVELNTDQKSVFWGHVMIYRENLKGEFKSFGTAETFASINHYDEYTIVPRNSTADHELRTYGVKKL